MSLGNVPRRNMSAEDKAIKARMAVMDCLISIHTKAGIDKDTASSIAFNEAVKLNRKQAEKRLAELKMLTA